DQFRALLTRSSLPNLFSLCGKALQIDANLGAASSIAEMLVQSHQEAMHLLPALPAEWSSGSVHGLRARGGYVVDLDWSGGALSRAVIHASRATRCVIRARGLSTVTLDGRAVKLERRTPGTVAFDVAAGGVYELR
ncbi:MAG: glycoside hydrolase family 95-like protein, partial [bacterium]